MTETARKSSGATERGKVIITCAITGAIHTPTMSPYLPITPDQIASEAIAAAEAGAAILHLHARDPETGKPDQTPEAFARFLPRIKQATGAAINITTGGSPYMKVEERVPPGRAIQARGRLAQHGLDQFRPLSPAEKYESFKFDWEKPHLEATRDLVFRNSFKDIEYILATCYRQRHPLRVRVLRHRASLQPRPFRRSRAGRSRRSSSSRSSASSAASAPIPRTSPI